MEARLMDLWNRATPDQQLRGRQWYWTAGAHAGYIAYAAGITVEQAAGIIAVLSPLMPWEENVRLAKDVVIWGKREGTFAANIEKAVRILNGEPVFDVLGGPKVRAFADAINGDRYAVTIDRHMLRAVGHPTEQVTARQYEAIAEVITRVAKSVGMMPRDFQAVIWCVVRDSQREAE